MDAVFNKNNENYKKLMEEWKKNHLEVETREGRNKSKETKTTSVKK